ncbi:MAG TPA: YlaH-like family protein [Lentibacillus sp.]|uniref:YlaH-like family protein n=1 Tax=Lentibacillus sp. TaxID=1925746 RepID=UPI002B4AC88E|nr:YlaH-like family protein [Lentibacillus sp.]HLR62253.1 YlaH-like family protein [Lentibacillus sp.]
MENSFSLVYELIVNYRDSINIYWVFYVINLILAGIAYKLGFAKDLPVLKSVLVYMMLAAGMLILNLFSMVGYPITDSLVVICLVLGIYRYRLHRERKAKQA